jgi:NAD(P)-dependent dehydrogenase (short-subunit alcohol dehydrogenase family)
MKMNDKTVLITGSTDGVGRYVATELAAAGAQVLIHGRDAARATALIDEIKRAGGTTPTFYQADLSSLADTRKLAEAVLADHRQLDVFVSNAGIGGGEPDGRTRRTSADGYELRFAVNYLAGFLLTLELLPLLRRSAPARIVNVASIGQHPIDFDDLMIERDYSGMRAYGQSKLAQIMSGLELATRLPAAQVTVNSLHPATYMPTKMVLQEIGYTIDTLDEGVAATHRLVSGADVATTTGRFFDRTQQTTANPQAYDAAARAKLWQRSLQLVDHADID